VPTTDQRERRLALEGATNFRDLGGYPAADGRRVRWGVIYRSDRLSALTASDHRRLAALELSLVCDLRSERERVEKPNRLDPGALPAVANIPVEVEAGNRIDALLAAGERDLPSLRAVVVSGYRELVQVHRHAWASLLHALAEPRPGAAVFHCSAGQDRTGFAAALLLLALGVPWEVVVRDYMLTAIYRPGEASVADINAYVSALGGAPLPASFLVDLWKPGPELLQASLESIEAEFGSVEDYLEEIGVGAAARAALRERLLG